MKGQNLAYFQELPPDGCHFTHAMYLISRMQSRSIPDMQASEPPAKKALMLRRDKLDELRRAHGIPSEAQLARVLNVNPATLWRVSNRDVAPSNSFIAQTLAAFPSASLDQLFEVVDVTPKAAAA